MGKYLKFALGRVGGNGEEMKRRLRARSTWEHGAFATLGDVHQKHTRAGNRAENRAKQLYRLSRNRYEID